jgi:glycosyltransferase involved in cell wall biosynthesis
VCYRADVRVLLINAFHYPRGGVERAVLDETASLTAAGHEVAHFAIRDPRNLPSPTAPWFAPHAEFGEGAPVVGQLLQLPRAIWSLPAAAALRRLLAAWPADVAHVHAPSRYLTPSVLRVLEHARVPAVMTLHDFKPWCTNRVMFARGAPCERCKGGRHIMAFRTACIHNSRAKSAVGALEAYVHDLVGAYRGVRHWIAPSRFVRDKVAEHGLDPARVSVVPHALARPGAEAAGAPATVPAGEPYVLYAGRLSQEKGVRLLPAVAMRVMPIPVVVAGDGPLGTWLREQGGSLPNLRLVGHVGRDELATLIARASVALVPSLSYETFCYAVAEALLAGCPVVASRIGAIPELMTEDAGVLVAPGDAHALAEGCQRVLADAGARTRVHTARAHVEALTDPARHRTALLSVFEHARLPGAG